LHLDEETYFISGGNIPTIKFDQNTLPFPICYEISIRKHTQLAFEQDAKIYVASMAKSNPGT
jgi:hypothetical protein